jgi:hypothetical protein
MISDSMATHERASRFSFLNRYNPFDNRFFAYRSVPVNSKHRHQFFQDVKSFLFDKVGQFLKDVSAEYMMHVNSREGTMKLSFNSDENLPKLKDFQRFVAYMNDFLYLDDPANSINPFSVKELSQDEIAKAYAYREKPPAAEFIISFDGTIYGYECKTMRNIAESLSAVTEKPS